MAFIVGHSPDEIARIAEKLLKLSNVVRKILDILPVSEVTFSFVNEFEELFNGISRSSNAHKLDSSDSQLLIEQVRAHSMKAQALGRTLEEIRVPGLDIKRLLSLLLRESFELGALAGLKWENYSDSAIKAGASAMLSESDARWHAAERKIEEMTNYFAGRVEVAEAGLDRNTARTEAFLSELDNINRRVDSFLDEAKRRISEKSSNGEKVIETIASGLRKEYQSTVEKLAGYETQAKTLIGSVASSAMAGGYAEHALKEKSSANLFRTYAVWLMMLVVTLLSVTLYQITISSISFPSIAFRIGISLLLSVPIAYLARESARHRVQHYKNIQIALDMTAINPYIESLSFAAQQELKKEMAQRVFFQGDKDSRGPDGLGIDLQEIIIKSLEKLDLSKKGG